MASGVGIQNWGFRMNGLRRLTPSFMAGVLLFLEFLSFFHDTIFDLKSGPTFVFKPRASCWLEAGITAGAL